MNWQPPTETDRECRICGAKVAAYEHAMVCHCQTVPWKLCQPLPDPPQEKK